MIFYESIEYKDWFRKQSEKTQFIILARLKRISEDKHWGFIHKFDGLIELKWVSGLRVYTAQLEELNLILLLGGNKNGQSKDIKNAQKILKKIKLGHFK